MQKMDTGVNYTLGPIKAQLYQRFLMLNKTAWLLTYLVCLHPNIDETKDIENTETRAKPGAALQNSKPKQ